MRKSHTVPAAVELILSQKSVGYEEFDYADRIEMDNTDGFDATHKAIYKLTHVFIVPKKKKKRK